MKLGTPRLMKSTFLFFESQVQNVKQPTSKKEKELFIFQCTEALLNTHDAQPYVNWLHITTAKINWLHCASNENLFYI